MDRTDKATSSSGQERRSPLGHSTFVISLTDAAWNHGNSAKGRKSSRPAIQSQNPCFEMFVTSTSEAFAPCCCDFICPSLDDSSNNGDLMRRQPFVFGEFDGRLQPELAFAVA